MNLASNTFDVLRENSSTMNAEITAGEDKSTVTMSVSDYRKNPALGDNKVTVSAIKSRDTLVKVKDTSNVNRSQQLKKRRTLEN